MAELAIAESAATTESGQQAPSAGAVVVAFLIDADNLCSASFVDEACRALEASEGTLSIRRAYGSIESLKRLTDCLRTWAIRPFCNLSLAKNTTDMALAIDAMELALQTPRPDVIVIGSGDADYLPLVVRLRERGIRMVCVATPSNMAHEAVHAYHRVLFVGTQHVGTQQGTAAGTPQLDAAPAAAVAVAVPKLAAKKASPAAAAKTKPAAAVPQGKPSATVKQILHHVPVLKGGETQHLSEVGRLLRDAGLLGKNASSTKLFKLHALAFELTPAKQPNQVRYTAAKG